MPSYGIEVMDREGKHIKTIENSATIDNLGTKAVTKKPIIALYTCDQQKIPDGLCFPNFIKKDESTLVILI